MENDILYLHLFLKEKVMLISPYEYSIFFFISESFVDNQANDSSFWVKIPYLRFFFVLLLCIDLNWMEKSA